MKKYLLVILVTFFYINSFGQEVSLMTYNIRLDVASDGDNAWPNRSEKLVSQLQFYAPDIFGIQEGMPHQVEFIDEQLSNYNFIGQGRDGENKGEYSALYFNIEKYNVVQQGTFWLSETPSEVSIGWDAAFPRVCTYGLFVNKETGVSFLVFNTHLDHIGNIAREKSLEFILRKIDEINLQNLPVILMGDFNLEPQSKAISILKQQMNDSQEISREAPFGPEGTFNGFNYFESQNRRIDYIFVSKNSSVKKYAVLNNSKDFKYASDHFPVFVELLLN